jgi:hypothetical protein
MDKLILLVVGIILTGLATSSWAKCGVPVVNKYGTATVLCTPDRPIPKDLKGDSNA